MGNNSTQVYVPSLVGGIPTKGDFVPSILFAIASALSLIPFIRRFINKDTRTIFLAIGTLSFSIERVIVYAIRAFMSHTHHPGQVLNNRLLVYQQASFTLGYLSFAPDYVTFVRTLMVNTTLEDPVRGSEDQPRTRFWMRRAADMGGLLWLIAIIPGVIAYSQPSSAIHDQQKEDTVFLLRYLSSGAAVVLIVAFVVILRYVQPRIRYLDRRAVDIVCCICAFTAIVPIYRLTILHHRTTSLNVLGTPPSSPLYPPDSLTTTPSKVTFYLFHCLPELIIATYIQSMNLRAVFNTGPFGDWGLMDKGFGIPQLRQNGVYVDGVGVPKKTTGRRERGEESPNTEEVVYDGDAKTEKETPQVTVVEVPLRPLVSQAS
ncbi:hypothetical protein FRB99_007245 [Tulasnella sp. 403]|nr:hypothetical protein FRB99_007245 [Tulasnella sp. 403]